MTMHLMRARASIPKTKTKVTKAKQAQWEADWQARNKWLKSIGLPKITLQEYIDEIHGRVKSKPQTAFTPMKKTATPVRDVPKIPSLVTTGGSCTKAAPKVYTGSAMLGIATMHKSNSVPVFSKEEAVNISTMRRS